MAKKTNDIIEVFKKKYDIKVSFEPVSLNDKKLDELSEQYFYKVFNVKRIDYSVINKLKDIISKYPDIPIFYNFLYGAYHINGKMSAAEEILDKINLKFPDYIFGVTQRANNLINKGLLDESKQWIGEEMNITKRFPKDYYHYSELKNYYLFFFELAIKEKDAAKAKQVLRILWELFPNEDELVSFAAKYYALHFSKIKYFEHTYTSTAQNERSLLNISEQSYDQEIFDIITYEVVYDDPKKISKYNPDYLCDELYKICISVYHNFDSQDEDDNVAILEAFQILSVSNYLDAFPLFITYITQDKEFVDYFWKGSENVVVEISFNFGKNDPDLLLTLLTNENIEDFLKVDIFESLVQLVLHGFLSAERLKSTYIQLMDRFISNLNTNLVVPTYLITMILPEALKLNDVEMLEKAEPFFLAKKIDTSYFGTYEDNLRELSFWDIKYAKKHFPKDLNDYLSGDYLDLNQTRPISEEEKILINAKNEDKFEDFLLNSLTKVFSKENIYDNAPDYYHPYEDEDEDEDSETDTFNHSKPIIKSTKIGRNDPCPCGSGKKFKKCCINKGIFQ